MKKDQSRGKLRVEKGSLKGVALMTDRQRVYHQVLAGLKPLMQSAKQGHVVTLAMMITGIVLGKKAQ